MVLLEVAEIRTEPVSGAAVLLLREVDGRRHLALWIAEPERLAITDAINEEDAGPEDAVEEFRQFLDQVSPDDFGPGPSTSG